MDNPVNEVRSQVGVLRAVYKCTVTVETTYKDHLQPDGAEIKHCATGSGSTAKIAEGIACAKILPELQEAVQRKKNALLEAKNCDDSTVHHHRSWIIGATHILQPITVYELPNIEELQNYVDRTKQRAQASKEAGRLCEVGLDTEGDPPTYMQLSAGSKENKDTVVFRLSKESWSVAENLFCDPGISMNVWGARDIAQLKSMYGESTPWLATIVDVQEIAAAVMKTTTPSLSSAVVFLRKITHPLEKPIMKFLPNTDKASRKRAYEGFSGNDGQPLPTPLLWYAGLDAALAVYAAVEFRDIHPTK
jgi:hypothetical protein